MNATLVLTRSEVADLLALDECIEAVERAFRAHAEGLTLPTGVLGTHVTGGGFHVKTAGINLPAPRFVTKVNANFPDNRVRFGLPTIQGVVLLFEALDGRPLAVMDSIEITIVRTGAATAVAAKHLARADSKTVTVCGCGNQGRVSLRALTRVLDLDRAYVWDLDYAAAERLATDLSGELAIEISPVRNFADAVGRSDVCVTCTPSRRGFLQKSHVRPGTFIAAVGADSEDKQELEPALVASSKVVVDIMEQCAAIGELHHALAQRLMVTHDVHAELGDVIAGKRPGRTSPEDVIVFDSTGTALQDVAAAVMVYDRAISSGRGTMLDLGASASS